MSDAREERLLEKEFVASVTRSLKSHKEALDRLALVSQEVARLHEIVRGHHEILEALRIEVAARMLEPQKPPDIN